MPVIRELRVESVWLSQLVELGKSETQGNHVRGSSFNRSPLPRLQAISRMGQSSTLRLSTVATPDAFRIIGREHVQVSCAYLNPSSF